MAYPVTSINKKQNKTFLILVVYLHFLQHKHTKRCPCLVHAKYIYMLLFFVSDNKLDI